ncbi:glycosyltransferase family 2 protein [Candidatus Sumerlaeota bacterium]|nr:glycosyltransferase family 2 protein [Candidatus Sumerlaeota bacterium]
MDRAKLTAILPAGNEEKNIAACMESVAFADEILVVVDAASTDGTEAIARAQGARVLVHEYINSAAQKNWAIPQATHPWVLIVDSDERVTPELKEDILEILRNDGPADGYYIHRINHFAGQRITGCGWQRDKVLRLFRRDRGRYEEKHVHADVVSRDDKPLVTSHLQGKFLHHTFESFGQYLKKHGRYAAWAGEDRAVNSGPVGLKELAVRPLLRFLRQYVMFGGYRDGVAGFMICWMAAHSVFLKYAHVWEKQRELQKAQRSDGE